MPQPPHTVQVLRYHALNQELELGRAPEFVFTSAEGKHLWPRNVLRRFDALIENAGVPKIRPAVFVL